MTQEITASRARTISKPGFYYDVAAKDYHADPCVVPSLSSGIARTIASNSPAHAKLEHPRLGGTPRLATPALSLGAYVHALVAGDVTEFEIGDFPTFQSAAAKKWMDAVAEQGKEPVLVRTVEDAKLIAKAVMEKAASGITNNPFTSGHAEVTAIWEESGIWMRARYDRLCVDPTGYADIWDWKTTDDISDHGIASAISKWGYHIQIAHYLRGLNALLPSHRGRVSFTMVFVEKSEPYTVRRAVLSPAYLAIGNRELNRAIALWTQATTTGEWPTLPVDTLEVEAPAYLDNDDEISIS